MSAKNKKKNTKKTVENERNIKKQICAIVLFFTSLLCLIISIVPGPAVWGWLHEFLLGLNGIGAIVWPVILGFISIMISLNKPIQKKRKLQIVGVSAITILLEAIIGVFMGDATQTFGKYLSTAYFSGIKSGGFFGGMLAFPFASGFGKAGAAVILIFIVTVLILLVMGITLSQFLYTISKPAKKIKNETQKAIEKKRSENLNTHLDKPANIDIPLTDEEERRRFKKEHDLDEKKKRLYDSYTGEMFESDDEHENAAEDTETEKVISDEIIEESQNSQEQDISDIISQIEVDTKSVRPGKPAKEIEIATGEDDEYVFPPLSLLNVHNDIDKSNVQDEMRANAELLVETLRSFGVETNLVGISRGPSVTRYELEPAAGVRINRIINLVDDIALKLATVGVRIEAPIPNKAAVGIEVPNRKSITVGLRELLDSNEFNESESLLTVAVGKDIAGKTVTLDLAKMPHLLVAGTTGSGKSVCINSFILSILYKASPEDVKFLLIDPKMVEFEVYNGLPHLLVPVVTDPRKASGALSWAVCEMEKRYKIFSECRVRDLQAYNEMARVSDEYDTMPQILIIVDEFCDLMMVASSSVEDSIIRLAAKARAAGMHLIIATQRPSTDVITGVIKANIPSRIALTVSNKFDSQIIIDMVGAEKLMGKGDMLIYPVGYSKPVRVQGGWVSSEEIESVRNFIVEEKGDSEEPVYDDEIEMEIERYAEETKKKKGKSDGVSDDFDDEGDLDTLFYEAAEIVIDNNLASISFLQRKLKVGFTRAGRLMDQLEAKGIVGPHAGSKTREVLMSKQAFMEMKMNSDS